MNCYKIIRDRESLLKFIEWLPELEPNEMFYCSLLARRKYSLDKNCTLPDKLSLKRFTSDKRFLFRKIWQLEVQLGAYSFSYDGMEVPVPEETLALYISPNPRSLEKAAKNNTKELLDKVLKPYDGYNPQSIALSEIQKANGTVKYFDFDFDNVAVSEVLTDIQKSVNLDACTIISTRGGFHLLVEISKVAEQYKKSWNPAITKIKGCDVRGTGGLLPVVGCRQGDYTPEFFKL